MSGLREKNTSTKLLCDKDAENIAKIIKITANSSASFGKLRQDANISKISWFKTGGAADLLYIPHDKHGMSLFFNALAENEIDINDAYVMGVGSNILIPDKGLRGITIRLGRAFNYIRLCNREDSSTYSSVFNRYDAADADKTIIVGAAVLDTNVAAFAVEKSIGGLEFLSGIPGTMGGALAMNAGCYGADIASVLIAAQAVNKNTGEVRVFSKDEIGYSYRSKSISNEWIFIEGMLRGYQAAQKDIINKMLNIKKRRMSSQPISSKTGGSTFRNPENTATNKSAWQLIKEAGCSGLKVGGAMVSEMHANFVINNDNATSSDIKELIFKVQDRVIQYSGIKLKPEIIIL